MMEKRKKAKINNKLKKILENQKMMSKLLDISTIFQ
jgi:hypothetical protein